MAAVVIEPRPEYTDDRTWCFWGSQRSGQDHLPLASWNTISVGRSDSHLERNVDASPYQMLRSIDFYEDAINEIQSGSHVQLRLGTSVIATHRLTTGLWETETTGGTITSEFVVDTRPPTITPITPILWQSFVGFEIECSQPVFDPKVAQLMRFQEACDTEIDFVYVLPTSPSRALIEFTTLSAECAHSAQITVKLNKQIEAICGGSPYQVLRTEQGRIPMGLPVHPAESPSTFVRVGVAAGSARPSSGYAFCRIQRWADACAQTLLTGGLPIGPLTDTPTVRFMDHIFLRVLRYQPTLGPDFFIALFQTVPLPRLLRFLCDTPTLMDVAFLVNALPKWPFLKECVLPDASKGKLTRKSACYP